jgi:membrane associated rhomboid family serine protease
MSTVIQRSLNTEVSHRLPVVTWGLILINITVFGVMQSTLDTNGIQQVFFQYGLVPAKFMLGQDIPPLSPIPYGNTLWTMLFIHAGWVHLVGNMLYLWVLGHCLEERFGAIPFLLFYLFCGFGGNLFYVALNSHSAVPSVGASGAISGLLAAFTLLYPRQPIVFRSYYGVLTLSAMMLVGMWIGLHSLILMNIVEYGAVRSGLAVAAHIGGFLAGFPIATYAYLIQTLKPVSD